MADKTNIDKKLLSRYLKNDLSDQEAYDLEQKVMQSPHLQEALDGLANSNISADDINADLQDIQNAWYKNKEKTTKVPAKRVQLWRQIAAAAAVLLLVFVGNRYWQYQQSTSDLFASHFDTTPQNDQIKIRGEGDTPSAKPEGLILYEQQQYEKSYAAFIAELEENPMKPEALLYAGLAAIQLGQETEAEHYFEQLTAIKSPEKTAAHWYLGLLLIKQERRAEAIPHLEIVKAQTTSSYFQQADDLLQQLQQ